MNLLSHRRELGEFKKRYKWMALFAIVCFGVLFLMLVKLQLVEREHWAGMARANITKTVTLPPTRGIVRDARGRVIASNRPSYEVYITPQLIRPQDLELFSTLMEFTEAEREAFIARLEAVPAYRRTHQIQMFTDVSRDQVASLETHHDDLPGVDVVARPVRHYPYGSLGAHAIGYLNEVSAEDLERYKDQGFRPGQRIGRSGVEQSLESILRGQPGYRRSVVDARGRRKEDHESAADIVPEDVRPVPGRDAVLALDMELMRSIHRAFRGHPSGAAVVVDVHTGKIRALYSKPSYDLNMRSGRLPHDVYQEMLENPFRPLIDKTIYESYFPGSTFKPFSSLAALRDGEIDPSTRITCKGACHIGRQRMRCTSAHGEVDARTALVRSCNVYFYRIAEMIGLENIDRVAREFGLGARTGIGINSESAGFLATRKWYEERFGRFRIGYTLNTAIGQGNTRVTLLQLALSYAAIANGGTLYAPQLIERIEAPDGTAIEEPAPQIARKLDFDPEHMKLIQEAMRGVVNREGGTAYEARIPGGVIVAGKTGTAEVITSREHRERISDEVDERLRRYLTRSHGWFGGFAPADDPEVAIIVLVEHGGAGGRTAAPIATQVLEEYLGNRDLALAQRRN